MAGIVAPFQEEVNAENYFPGEGFEKILSQVGGLLTGQSSLVVLTGDAGTGKTMLCLRLAEESAIQDTIFFPETVESFGSVVSHIADSLDFSVDENLSTEEQIQTIAEGMQAENRAVFVIFDQAENIYLATMERIRKMIDTFQEAGCHIHAMFSGRPVFLENFKQLSIIDFNDITEESFELQEISEAETADYIYSALEKNPEIGEGRDLFTPEAIAELYNLTGGNFYKINSFARELLEYADDEEFVAALLNDGSGKRGATKILPGISFGKMIQSSKRAFHDIAGNKGLMGVLLGGLVVLLFTIWFVFVREQGPEKPVVTDPGQITVKVKENGEVVTQKSTEVVPQEQTPDVEMGEVAADTKVENTTTAEVTTEKNMNEQQAGNTVAQQEVVEPETIVPDKPKKEVKQQGAIATQEEVVESVPANKAPEKITSIRDDRHKLKIPGVKNSDIESIETVEKLEQPAEVPGIKATAHKVKKDVAKTPEDNQANTLSSATEESGQVVTPVSAPASDENIVINAADPTTPLEWLVQNRFVAGLSWKNHARDEWYTIPLMEIGPKAAGRVLKNLFTDASTKKLVTDLYLFSDEKNPGAIVVFYGEFPNKQKAEEGAKTIGSLFNNNSFEIVTVAQAMKRVAK